MKLNNADKLFNAINDMNDDQYCLYQETNLELLEKKIENRKLLKELAKTRCNNFELSYKLKVVDKQNKLEKNILEIIIYSVVVFTIINIWV